MINICSSEKSVASNVSDSIVNTFWYYWLRSDERYPLFARYSGYNLQVRWIHLSELMKNNPVVSENVTGTGAAFSKVPRKILGKLLIL